MSELYETIASLCASRGITGGKLCGETGLSRGKLTDLKMGRTKSLSSANLQKIADYFGVSVDFLLGKEDKKETPRPEGRGVSDDDIKFALFGDNPEITDEMFEDVKRFARFIAEKKKE